MTGQMQGDLGYKCTRLKIKKKKKKQALTVSTAFPLLLLLDTNFTKVCN